MWCEQKIKYFQYREEGVEAGSAGFVKLDCWGDCCNMTMQVSHLNPTDCGERTIYFEDSAKQVSVGKIMLEEGRGRLELPGLKCNNLLGSGLSVDRLMRVRIWISPGRDIVCVLGKLPPYCGELQTISTRELQDTGDRKEYAQPDGDLEPCQCVEPDEDLEPCQCVEPDGDLEPCQCVEPDGDLEPSRCMELNEDLEPGRHEEPNGELEPDGEGGETENADGIFIPYISQDKAERSAPSRYTYQGSIKPDKWEQLCQVYPQICPFGDGRRYLNIGPGDFVILKEKSYRRVNNSFLLHGYFQYKHLILHRAFYKGETKYYIGVPGNYYDKEKEVALLFGFESFEGAKEPAAEGDFGYYMMRVEL